MCSQHNVRVTAGDNTGQNTKDTHPVPRLKLEYRESNPGRQWKAGHSTDQARATDILFCKPQNRMLINIIHNLKLAIR